MPNYSLVANTQFQNRSFDDLLKPLAMYTQEYNSLEDALGELDTKASIWEGMANEESDPIAYAQYKRYADDLRSQAASLAQTGLNPLSRKSMLNLKRRYAAEIAPIEQAYANRKIQADEQRKALLQNPTLLLSRRADVTSLDDYLKNPQLGYESYSGALLTQQVGTAAAQIAKSLREYGNGKALDGFTKTWLQEHGYTAEEVWQAIHNPDSPKSSRILNSMVDNVMADSGIPQWADRGTLNQAYNYARQGLWQAVGQTQIQTYTDEAAKLEAQLKKQKELVDYQLQKQAEYAQAAGAKHPQLKPRALRSQQAIEQDDSLMKEFIRRGYVIEKDGKFIVTPLGRKEYERVPYDRDPRSIIHNDKDLFPGGLGSRDENERLSIYDTAGSSFREFMDRHNGGKPLLNERGTFMPNQANNVFTKAYKNNNLESYDMYHSTEYVMDLTETQGKRLRDQVFAEPEGTIQKMEFTGKKGFKGETIGKDKLEGFRPVRFSPSRFGTTITWVNDKGESIRTNAPKGVNEMVTNEVQRAFEYENFYNQVLQAGKMPRTKENGSPLIDEDGIVQFTNMPLTEEETRNYYNSWRKALDSIQTMAGMYIAPSETETTKYGSYDFSSGINYNWNNSSLIDGDDD